MVYVDAPLTSNGAAWFFFCGPGRSPEGSNTAQRRLIAFGGLRGEVNNGGFDQWFLNGAGDLAPDAFGFVGAVEHLALTKILDEAFARFSSPFPLDRSKRHEELLQFEQDWADALNSRYYAIEESESLDALMDTYVLDNWSAFFGVDKPTVA